MKFPALAIFGLIFGLVTPAAHASNEVRVDGRTYVQTCTVYTTMVGDFRVTYQNTALPLGTRIALVLGWAGFTLDGGRSVELSWSARRELDMSSTSFPYTWSADLSQVLAQRSNPLRYQALQFVLRIQPPGGTEYYENGTGTSSARGYFMTKLPTNVPCVNETLPPVRQLPVEVVLKN